MSFSFIINTKSIQNYYDWSHMLLSTVHTRAASAQYKMQAVILLNTAKSTIIYAHKVLVFRVCSFCFIDR